MKKIHFVIDKSKIVDYSIAPVRYNKKELRKRGYEVKFFYQLTEQLFNCDFLLLVSKPVLKMLQENKMIISEPSPTIEFLKKARLYANKIIWMDNSDSTTVTHFELLPYIDLYLKKQLFKDKTLYQKDFVGGRIFTDYYHSNFNIEDDIKFKQFFPLDLDLSYKVGLSWNIGLGDMYNAFTKMNYLQRRFPNIKLNNYNINFISPNSDKSIDVFIRTSSDLSRKLVAFHRQKLIEETEAVINKNNLNGSTNGKWLTTKEFRSSLKKSKILPSPFGWGEIGVRDYEAFIFGGLLLKPDMSYMDTWPNIFLKGETYQSFSWDFEDLETVIVELLNNKKKRIQIARNGQQAYKESVSEKGMERFCDWFIQQINL